MLTISLSGVPVLWILDNLYKLGGPNICFDSCRGFDSQSGRGLTGILRGVEPISRSRGTVPDRLAGRTGKSTPYRSAQVSASNALRGRPRAEDGKRWWMEVGSGIEEMKHLSGYCPA